VPWVVDMETKFFILEMVSMSRGAEVSAFCFNLFVRPASSIAIFRALGVTVVFCLVFDLIGVGTRPGNRGVCRAARWLCLRVVREVYMAGALAFSLVVIWFVLRRAIGFV
jgi:hypothetical protein